MQDATAQPVDTPPAASASQPTNTAAVVPTERLNLLAAANGGHLVRAPHDRWNAAIDGDESWDYAGLGEAVFGFEGDRPATFDSFQMLVTETRDWNVKEFELSAGDDPKGHFASIGKFETENVRLYPSAWQEFQFQPRTARYLKVAILSMHRPGGTPQIEEWRLLGTSR